MRFFDLGAGHGYKKNAADMREAMRPVTIDELREKWRKLRAELALQAQGKRRLILHRDDERILPPQLAWWGNGDN